MGHVYAGMLCTMWWGDACALWAALEGIPLTLYLWATLEGAPLLKPYHAPQGNPCINL